MNGEEFASKCWKCLRVRQFIVDESKSRDCNDPRAQEDHVQEAWLAISTLPHCYGVDGCIEIARSAIYSSYWQENKGRLLRSNPGEVGNASREGWDDGSADDGPQLVYSQRVRMTASGISRALVQEILDTIGPILKRHGWQ